MTRSENCVVIYTDIANQIPAFTIPERNLYVPVVTLSTQDNANLLPQLKSGFKRTISWNKYLSKPELLAQNPNLNLVEPSFQGVNRVFILAFEEDAQRTSNKRYYIPNVNVEKKYYNVMVDVKNFFDQPVKNNKVTYENIRKIATGQGCDYTTGCLLNYIHFRNNYKKIVVDLSKQHVLDADPKTIQQTNFTPNLDRPRNTRIFFILVEVKETAIVLSQGTVIVL